MIRKIGRNMVNKYLMSGDGPAYARRKTGFEKWRGRDMVVDWDEARELFHISDNSGAVFVARKERVRLQNRGVEARRERLLSEYLGKEDIVRAGDIVVDCGANIGEFSVACAKMGAVVHAFEPDPKEFGALKANAIDGMIVNNLALWCRTETLTFYESNKSGDSSLIDMGSANSVIKVDAVRIDKYIIEKGISRIRLLKVEAEGAEPEVLEGCGDSLKRVDYVAVDMGPERGVDKDNTVVEVMDRLLPHGFKLNNFNSMRFSGLFSRV